MSAARKKSPPPMKNTVRVYADYSQGCEVCGQKPVVSATGMCGPCTFGEADCLDPSEWEGNYTFGALAEEGE